MATKITLLRIDLIILLSYRALTGGESLNVNDIRPGRLIASDFGIIVHQSIDFFFTYL